MHLAVDEQRVHDDTAVVDRDVLARRDPAGLGVDLDDRDVRAERERGTGPLGVVLHHQRLAALRCRPPRAPTTRAPCSAHPRRRGGRRRRRRCLPARLRAARLRAPWPSRRRASRSGGPRCRRAAPSATRRCRRRAARARCRTARSVICSIGTPSWSATICVNAVAWPCPCADVPAFTVTRPSSCTSTSANSEPPPVTST